MWNKLKKYSKVFNRLKSLRVCIFVIVLVVGIVPTMIIGYGIMSSYENQAVTQQVNTVQNQLRILAEHLVSNNYLDNYQNSEATTSRQVINAELEMFSSLYDGRVQVIDDGLKIITDTYSLSEGKTIISEEVIKCFLGESTSNYDRGNGYIELTTPITSTDADGNTVVKGVMLTSISTSNIIDMLDVLRRKAIIEESLIGFAVLALALILSYLLTHPFRKLARSVDEVKAGYRDEKIPESGYQETIQIAEAFNQLLARNKVLDDSREEFVANVSHELKTPMTSMKVLADSLVSQDDVPVELYREFMEDIVSEIDRENDIISDLLTLVKMDENSPDMMNITEEDINELTEKTLERLTPMASEKNVEITFESVRPVTADVDRIKLSMLFSNLVENAIKYNKEGGWVRVKLDADHQSFTFEISDSGMGIPQESLEHIYERFYRVDKSHSKEIGGTGLGLAIVRNVVRLHKGTITVTSTEGEGTTFLVKIPLNYITQQPGE